MKNRKTIYVLIGVIVVVGAACAAYVVMRPAQPKPLDHAGSPVNPSAAASPGAAAPQPTTAAGINPGNAP